MLVQYAVMWHLTLETKSGGVMALYAVFGFLPQAVLSIFGGVWADRLDRKKLIIGADATIAVVTLALALFMAAGATDLWLIFVAIAIRSAGAGIQMPAVAALLPQIVPADKLMRVNGINGTIQSAMMLVAPAAAAAVYASMSIVAVFYIDVVTAVIGIGLLLLVTVPRLVRSAEEQVGYFDDLVGGVRYVVTHTFVRWILVLYAVVFVLIVAPSFLTPLMIVRTFGEEVWKLTVNELAFSIGMVLGGAAVAAWAGKWNRVADDPGLHAGVRRHLDRPRAVHQHLGVLRVHVPARPVRARPSRRRRSRCCRRRSSPRCRGACSGSSASSWPCRCRSAWRCSGRWRTGSRVESLLVWAGVALLLVVALALAVPGGRRAMQRGQRARHGVSSGSMA